MIRLLPRPARRLRFAKSAAWWRAAALAACMAGATHTRAAESSSASATRIAIPAAKMPLDSNIQPLYAIEQAAWIWHPQFPAGQEAVLLFHNEFTVAESIDVAIHVSADQRYELTLDGKLISLGPDRGDLAHWSFATYQIHLSAGTHVVDAVVAWIGDWAPGAQLTQRGGFIFAAEGPLGATLDTGRGSWLTRPVKGWSFAPGPFQWSVGGQHTIDGVALFGPQAEWIKPAIIVPALRGNIYGLMRTPWRLQPSRLPEQKIAAQQIGVVRAVLEGANAASEAVTADQVARASTAPEWTRFLTGQGSMQVAAHTIVSILVDLQDYYTAYPHVRLSGGRGSKVTVAWTEALYERDAAGKRSKDKGQRDIVVGKIFHGIEDHFLNDGGAARDYRPWWWRAGRYVMLTVRTGTEPLTLERLDFLESRYPLEDEGRFVSSDKKMDAIQPLLVRGLQMCAHETYMDCPFYEQLMYVGDTRLEMLTTYAMTADARLPKRGIELYDWSRSTWGLVAEHYPSRTPQLSPTFSLLWVSMLRDFAYWRDDPAFVRDRLPGMRGVLEQFRGLRGSSGLLEQLPGWPFVDWVQGWRNGNAPDGIAGISSVNNLFFVQALRDAADIEASVGDSLMAQRNRDLARELSAEIVKRFWVEERGLFADDEKHQSFSEHAQCLALLNGVLDAERAQKCFQALLTTKDLHRATIYFSFYLFEVFKQQNRGDLIVARMDFWKALVERGLKTPVEQPEPSRSDCHAWGSHPLFHFRASLFGIRPTSPGFHEIEIAPSPGNLSHLEVKMPHPNGWIEGRLDFADGKCHGEITVPAGVKANFRWNGKTTALTAGATTAIP